MYAIFPKSIEDPIIDINIEKCILCLFDNDTYLNTLVQFQSCFIDNLYFVILMLTLIFTQL